MNDETRPLDRCRTIGLSTRPDARGKLSFIEGARDIPFEIRRVYYLYDVPLGAERGGHAHRALEAVFIAIHGSFELKLNDGQGQRSFRMSEPNRGVYVCPMIWREVSDFSEGAVCLVLASDHYDESDYIRDYPDFIRAVRRY